MTIIEMANEAELCQCIWIDDADDETVQSVIRFAKLIAAKEREACANVCYELMLKDNPYDQWRGQDLCMKAIRARGE